MQSFSKITYLQKLIFDQKKRGQVIGLVPTMGNLHAGHLKLVEEAKEQCDIVICTIFVNPLQFGPKEDLEAYPRSLETDMGLLAKLDCDCLFHPDTSEIYPHGIEEQTIVSVPGLTENFCGRSRPGHFEGVTTVVSKLFNICQPDRAYFGLKDYQQYLVIKRMVQDLRYPIEVLGVETQREVSGLAMSSRNNYLSAEQRQLAPLFNQSLLVVADALTEGNREFNELEETAIKELETAGIEVDYIAICNAETLNPAHSDDPNLVILGAVFIGKTRLIDNILVHLK